jgi:hypothetical protein
MLVMSATVGTPPMASPTTWQRPGSTWDQFKFCGDCGASLVPASRASSTPSLTTQPQPPSRYTPTYLAEKILTSKSALEGERKQVTVLFADLKGSMELLADRDRSIATKAPSIR